MSFRAGDEFCIADLDSFSIKRLPAESFGAVLEVDTPSFLRRCGTVDKYRGKCHSRHAIRGLSLSRNTILVGGD
jgi:hypothetical protein